MAILGDTSYGECCVDEVAAEHVGADAVVHFGHACMTPTERLPVLFVFTVAHIDVPAMVDTLRREGIGGGELEGRSYFTTSDITKR